MAQWLMQWPLRGFQPEQHTVRSDMERKNILHNSSVKMQAHTGDNRGQPWLYPSLFFKFSTVLLKKKKTHLFLEAF